MWTRRLLAICALWLIAATPEETKLLRPAETMFHDRVYDVAEHQFTEFLNRFPSSDRAVDVRLMLAQSQLGQGKWVAAVTTLEAGVPAGQSWPDGFRYWQAEALAFGERYAEAGESYQALLAQSPTGTYRAQAQYGLAFVRFKQGRYAEATAVLAELAQSAPREGLPVEAELLRGQILLAEQKYAEADAVFEPILKRDRSSRVGYRALRWRAEVAARQGEFDKAAKRYGEVLEAWKLEPNRFLDAQLAAEAWAGLGWIAWQQEKFDVTIDSFSQALGLAREPWLRREAMVKLGEAYVRAGKLAQGVARLKDFIKDRPSDPLAEDVQLAIADLFYSSGDFVAALAEYRELATKYPRGRWLAKALFQAGWCEAKQNRLVEALAYFEPAFTAAADASGPAADAELAAEAVLKVADVQFQLGRLQDAVGSYQQLISRYPGSPHVERALFQLGHVYHRMQNAEAAIHVFDSLVEQYPQSPFGPEAAFQVGLINSATDKQAEARAAYTKVIEKFPASPWAERARLAIGESFYRESKYDEAIAAFEQLIDAAPDSELAHRALFNRGLCDQAKGEPEKTLAGFSEFLIKFPQSPLGPEMQFWMGDYYLRQKDYVKAQEQFQAIAKNQPTSERADAGLFFAAKSAFLRQDRKIAIELFGTLVRTYTNSPWRCDARFGQGDALTRENQFEDALQVFDSLIKQFPDCHVACEAIGRKGDCQFTLKRYEDAIATYLEGLQCAPETDPSLRNELYYKLGKAYEKAGKTDEALIQYVKVIYETVAWPAPDAPPERYWLCQCGIAAAAIKEQKQQWRDAIKLYERLVVLCPDMKELFEDKIRKLRVEHFILF